MVTKYGMSDKLGAISYDSDQEVFIGRSMGQQARTYSEEVAGQIDQEIKAILDEGYRRCREILSTHREELERTAQYLLEFETMSAADFDLVFTDPDGLEQRKEETRRERAEKAKAEEEERARLQAEEAAETARRLREADEALRQKQAQSEDHLLPPTDPF
jgi:hypothetical protein